MVLFPSLAAVRLALASRAAAGCMCVGLGFRGRGEGVIAVWAHELLGLEGKRDYAGMETSIGVRAGPGTPRHC